jgi:hypothetical protein
MGPSSSSLFAALFAMNEVLTLLVGLGAAG